MKKKFLYTIAAVFCLFGFLPAYASSYYPIGIYNYIDFHTKTWQIDPKIVPIYGNWDSAHLTNENLSPITCNSLIEGLPGEADSKWQCAKLRVRVDNNIFSGSSSLSQFNGRSFLITYHPNLFKPSEKTTAIIYDSEYTLPFNGKNYIIFYVAINSDKQIHYIEDMRLMLNPFPQSEDHYFLRNDSFPNNILHSYDVMNMQKKYAYLSQIDLLSDKDTQHLFTTKCEVNNDNKLINCSKLSSQQSMVKVSFSQGKAYIFTNSSPDINKNFIYTNTKLSVCDIDKRQNIIYSSCKELKIPIQNISILGKKITFFNPTAIAFYHNYAYIAGVLLPDSSMAGGFFSSIWRCPINQYGNVVSKSCSLVISPLTNLTLIQSMVIIHNNIYYTDEAKDLSNKKSFGNMFTCKLSELGAFYGCKSIPQPPLTSDKWYISVPTKTVYNKGTNSLYVLDIMEPPMPAWTTEPGPYLPGLRIVSYSLDHNGNIDNSKAPVVSYTTPDYSDMQLPSDGYGMIYAASMSIVGDTNPITYISSNMLNTYSLNTSSDFQRCHIENNLTIGDCSDTQTIYPLVVDSPILVNTYKGTPITFNTPLDYNTPFDTKDVPSKDTKLNLNNAKAYNTNWYSGHLDYKCNMFSFSGEYNDMINCQDLELPLPDMGYYEHSLGLVDGRMIDITTQDGDTIEGIIYDYNLIQTSNKCDKNEDPMCDVRIILHMKTDYYSEYKEGTLLNGQIIKNKFPQDASFYFNPEGSFFYRENSISNDKNVQEQILNSQSSKKWGSDNVLPHGGVNTCPFNFVDSTFSNDSNYMVLGCAAINLNAEQVQGLLHGLIGFNIFTTYEDNQRPYMLAEYKYDPSNHTANFTGNYLNIYDYKENNDGTITLYFTNIFYAKENSTPFITYYKDKNAPTSGNDEYQYILMKSPFRLE
ncbi:hypothetical protein [Francisella sp. 19X1-34]|uniref:hypothetical protein n=1 Tax=Francisella sp. 19X1-34 TaxID=3087177 RepID=UPI002E33460A|nr:hypothetical protein [Francisella sp. 19X1-34]MED7789463.1 hypothetical protein [Francisella sp. 19X1-34]